MADHVPPLPKVNTPVAKSWSRTYSKVSNFNHVWTIDNFNFYYDFFDCPLKSPTFSINVMSKWYLQMRLQEMNENYTLLVLNLVSCNKFKIRAKYTFSILNYKREKVDGEECIFMFVDDGTVGCRSYFKRSLLLDKDNEQLPVNELTIFCEGSILTDITNVFRQSHTVQINIPECRLSDSLGQLFENGKFSDIMFTVHGRKIQAHKAILGARSPIFSAIFDGLEEEKKTYVDIVNMDYEVLIEMLRFIYTGKAEKLEKIAKDLFTVADEYALKELKIMCEEALCTNLTIENAAEMLIFADYYCADQLKLQAIGFITTHATHVMDTEYFKTMVIYKPDLLVDAFRVVTQQIKSIN